MNLKRGDKVIAMGYRSKLTRDVSLKELRAFYGGFYGYEPFTGYPVFDDPKRVAVGQAPWVYDSLPTQDEAHALMRDVPRGA